VSASEPGDARRGEPRLRMLLGAEEVG
jgi:hypothetical protein